MGYRLKSGLSKTAVYQAILDNNTSGIVLPALRDCEFESYRASYWLEFDGYEIYFSNWAGSVVYTICTIEYLEECDQINENRVCFCYIPFQYVLDHGMIREVG